MRPIDPDDVLQRYKNLASLSIEPRVFDIQMRAVSVEDGYVIVIRVPKSWHPPHRVCFKNSNRFYRRDSVRAYEASVDELRILFTSSATIQERIRGFRAERLGRIEARDTPKKLLSEPCVMVLHLVPLSAYRLSHHIDLEKATELCEFSTA